MKGALSGLPVGEDRSAMHRRIQNIIQKIAQTGDFFCIYAILFAGGNWNRTFGTPLPLCTILGGGRSFRKRKDAPPPEFTVAVSCNRHLISPKKYKNARNFTFFALIICTIDYFVVNLHAKLYLDDKRAYNNLKELRI
jgi:hypothetical protein